MILFNYLKVGVSCKRREGNTGIRLGGGDLNVKKYTTEMDPTMIVGLTPALLSWRIGD